MKNISPLEAADILRADNGAILIDVRTYGEVAEEAIPGAKHIPLDELSSRLDEVENFSSLLFLCRSGGRSAVASSIAESAGRDGVMNVVGGIMAWMKEGLPVSRGKSSTAGFAHKNVIVFVSIITVGLIVSAIIFQQTSAAPSSVLVSESTSSVSDFSSLKPKQFAEAISRDKVVLLDVRTADEYASGHIANATNIDFYDSTFRDKLSALNKDEKYYVYCRSGHRSGSTLSVMRELGFAHVYDLAGGIVSWQNEGRPLAR